MNDILKAAAHFFGAGVRSANQRDDHVHRRTQGPDQLRAVCDFDFVTDEITCDFGFNISKVDCDPNFNVIT